MNIAPHRLKPIRYTNDIVVSSCTDREDVLLWRVLHETKNGFFIDVGAGDPNWNSPLRWFSVNGWTGINLEPHPVLFPIVQQWRPRDTNIQCGVSDQEGELTFYKVNPTESGIAWGLSSFEPASAETARKAGYTVIEEQVPTLRLDRVINENAADRTIDLLKIDVEGYEGAVLRSLNFQRYRPRVVCVEATAPCSPNPVFANWEHLITENDYTFALFDGINNYYVRNEDSENILSQFNCGLTANDRYVKATETDMKEPWL